MVGYLCLDERAIYPVADEGGDRHIATAGGVGPEAAHQGSRGRRRRREGSHAARRSLHHRLGQLTVVGVGYNVLCDSVK